jgi:hypothetical protein
MSTFPLSNLCTALKERHRRPPREPRRPPVRKVGTVNFANAGDFTALVADVRRRLWGPTRVFVRLPDQSRVEVVLQGDLANRFRSEVRRGSLVRFSVQARPGRFKLDRKPLVGAVELVAQDWVVESGDGAAPTYPRVGLIAAVVDMAVKDDKSVFSLRYVGPDGWVESEAVLELTGGDLEGCIRRGDVIALSATVALSSANRECRRVLVCHALTRLPAELEARGRP